MQRNASSAPWPLAGGSLRLTRPFDDGLGGGSGGGSTIFDLEEGDGLPSGFISNFGTRPRPRPLSSSEEEEEDDVDSVEGSLVKFGGFGFGLESAFGTFVQNSDVNPVKSNEIQF